MQCIPLFAQQTPTLIAFFPSLRFPTAIRPKVKEQNNHHNNWLDLTQL
jgi:hypothetical protein